MEILLTIYLIITLIAISIAIKITKDAGKFTIGDLLVSIFLTLTPVINFMFICCAMHHFKFLDFKLWEHKKPK